MTEALHHWNRVSHKEATEAILPCNGALTWAEALAAQRPFAAEEELLEAADAVWLQLSRDEWQQAFASHPRLGERHATAATAQSLAWSAGEQGSLSQEASLQTELAAGNRVYEEKFGRVFLLCAAGKSTAEVLRALRLRLGNDPETELRETAEQQRRIMQLRLRRWLSLPVPNAEDV